jgi:hypothetical protein
MNIQGMSALVTGGGSGLGEATARWGCSRISAATCPIAWRISRPSANWAMRR